MNSIKLSLAGHFRTLSKNPRMVRWIVWSACGAILALVLINSLVAHQGNQALINSQRETGASQSTLTMLSRLFNTVDNAETGQRGYLLTGDIAYLQPYTSAQQAINGRLQTLKVALSGEELQQQRFAQLDVLIQNKFSEIQNSITLYQQHQTESALQVVKSGYGAQLMTVIRQLISQMVTTENQRFAQFETHSQRITQQIRGETGFATLVAFFGILLLGYAITRAATRSQHLNLQLEQALTALQTTNDALFHQNERVQEANRMKSQFLANMSHELRTPLNGIIGFTELLADPVFGVTDPEQADYLGDILTSARHLLHLINDILDLAKIEAGKTVFTLENGEMMVVLNEVQTALQPLITHKKLHFAIELDPDVTTLHLDLVKLKQIFLNILSNAIKFTPEKGAVTVHVRPQGTDAFVAEIVDTGIGITPEDLPRLFTAFQQLDDGIAKKQQGTGLGLVLTKQLVEAQGGQLTVQSTVGQGSTFTFSLPRWMRENNLSLSPSPSETSTGSGVSLLVVDDNPDDQHILTGWLRDAGYHVTAVSTGHEAIATCQQQCFAAIILDLILPDMHGQEVLRAIREINGYVAVPVIVVTVIPDKSIGLGSSIQDILIKPTQPEELLDALRQSGVIPYHAKVLVIDDSPTIRKLLEVSLTRDGFEPQCCDDGASGLAMLDQMVPDVIILDLLMPNINGWEVLTALRAKQDTHDIPVIIWTSADLSHADHVRLRQDAQSIALKGLTDASEIIQLVQQCVSTSQHRSSVVGAASIFAPVVPPVPVA